MARKTHIKGADGKVDGIVRHCMYMIATGKWGIGDRLPSVRKAEEEWGINRLTVQKAYRDLEKQGLAESRARSGYYVSDHGAARRLARNRYQLENLYQKLEQQIRESTAFSPLAVFRYMSRLAELRASEHPDCAFVECTFLQAEGHAAEIRDRLGVPVEALVTDDVNGRADRLPPGVRVVFTTLFHYDELHAVGEAPDVELVSVPIEISPDFPASIDSGAGHRVVLLETEESMARHVADDALKALRGGGMNVDVEIVSDLESRLASHVNRSLSGVFRGTILLSPRHWGAIGEELRKHSFIRPVPFKIAGNAWRRIAEAIGLPTGELPV